MFDSVVLDVVIGLIFVYLLYSLLATIIQEIVATNFGFRAKILEKAVMRMLDDGQSSKSRISSFLHLFLVRKSKQPPFTSQFYNHPLIKYLAQDKWHSKPAYLSAQNFSKVLIDLLRGKQHEASKQYGPSIEDALKEGRTKWGETPINKETGEYLCSIWVDAEGNIDRFKKNLEDWFDETMDRASGWYKQYTQVILLFVGFGIAMLFNVDTLQIVRKLEKDPALRQQLVAQAEAYGKAHPNLPEELRMEKQRNEALLAAVKDSSSKMTRLDSMNQLSQAKYDSLKMHRDSLFTQATRLVQNDIGKINNALALGWGNYGGASGFFGKVCYVICSSFCGIKLLGLALTAIAISLGAPFWFDILNKLTRLRGALKGEDNEKNKVADKKVEVVNVNK